MFIQIECVEIKMCVCVWMHVSERENGGKRGRDYGQQILVINVRKKDR